MRENTSNEQITNEGLRHSPEVERLMSGKLPFVTRHGITIVALILVLVGIRLSLTEGSSKKLMRELINFTIGEIRLKI